VIRELKDIRDLYQSRGELNKIPIHVHIVAAEIKSDEKLE